MAKAVHENERAVSVDSTADRYRPDAFFGDIAFCCVDSTATQKVIWRLAGRGLRFWRDGRMLRETLRVLTVPDDQGRDRHLRANVLF